MNTSSQLPRLLIIDDVFGRTVPTGINQERRALCGQYLIQDATCDGLVGPAKQIIRHPIAEAVFCRGQTPASASIGDVVEDDLPGVMQVVRDGWMEPGFGSHCWSLVLLDLCFYTGRVTNASDSQCAGSAQGREQDDNPSHYFGIKVLKALHERFPDLPVVILSSKPRDAVSLEFSSLGALGFIDRSSPKSPGILRDYIWRHGLIPDTTGEIAGQSKGLLFLLRAARRAAGNRRNLLIQGERGSGKELLASYIHDQTYIKEPKPFVTVDSGTLDSHLYASALFGYRRGAFTGAERNHTGLILEADKGDLFLDEIGNMPVGVQAGLLRVLEQRKVVPLGATTGLAVDARFISATNEDIEGRASIGAFRPDLLDRLRQGGILTLPPLRERPEDLSVLVEKFVREAESTVSGAFHREVEPSALEQLRAYDWPGNIRELRDCIFRAVTSHSDVEFLVPAHLSIPRTSKQFRHARSLEPLSRAPVPAIDSLEQLADLMENLDFNKLPRALLVGRLKRLQKCYARLVARYLRVMLELTRRPTPQNPEGEILIHPAVKLITGDQLMTASKASDLIKRLLRIDPIAVRDLLEDPVLAEAYERAQRLRPASSRTPTLK